MEKKILFWLKRNFILLLSAFVILSCHINDDEDALKAAWSGRVQVYTVTFDSNNDSGKTKTQEILSTEFNSKLLRENDFTKSNYAFVGWNTKPDGSGISYIDSEFVKNVAFTERKVVLYAQWVRCYMVVLDSNNGSGKKVEQMFLLGRNQNILRNPFTKTGYGLVGWAYDKNATAADYVDCQNISVSSAFTLYAIWTPDIYTLTFKSNDGSYLETTQNYVYGVYQDLNATSFTRTGYSFVGWGTSENDTVAAYSDGQNITLTGNTELFAIWSINSYTLTFAPNGAEGTAYSRTVVYNTLETADECSFATPVGYYYGGGWYSTQGGVETDYPEGGIFNMPAYDLVLNARWIEKPAHSITYNNTKGASNPNDTSYREKNSITLSNLTLLNYKFVGWYLNNEGSPVTGWAPGTYTEDLNLYARWTEPDVVKGSSAGLGYAGDKSLVYTLRYYSSRGGFDKSLTYHSGDSVPTANFDNVPTAAVADGVRWTLEVTAVNTEYGLRYTGSASATVSNNHVNVTFPDLYKN